MSNKEIKNVLVFVTVAFLLLGVLFGMNIMTFIFGSLGKVSIDTQDPILVNVINESGGFINSTGYAVTGASNSTFLGNVIVTTIYNASSGAVIGSGNYTVNSANGVITNATPTSFVGVNITYSYSGKSPIRVSLEESNNGSLQAVITYTNQSDTQMSTVAIAITLVILIVLFLIFWKSFISPMMKNGKGSSAGGNVFS